MRIPWGSSGQDSGAPTARGPGSIPGWRTKIPQASQKQKQMNKTKYKNKYANTHTKKENELDAPGADYLV